ncbi:MAG: hypothetical protein ACLR8R_10020 [Oscillospiraceae bacterium]
MTLFSFTPSLLRQQVHGEKAHVVAGVLILLAPGFPRPTTSQSTAADLAPNSMKKLL